MILAVSIPVAVTQSPHGPQWWAITAIFVGLALLIFVFVLKALVQTWAEEERIRRALREERDRATERLYLEAQKRRHTLHVGHPTHKTTAGPVALKPQHLGRRAGGSTEGEES